MTRPVLTTAFSLAPTWWRGHAWRRDGSGAEELFSGQWAVQAARRADAAGFDLAFRPDSLAVDPRLAADGPERLGLDPFVQIAALAHVTRRISFVPTVSATFAEPFAVARQLVSLEQLTGGRIGWNVVTSLDGDGNFQRDRPDDSAQRWDRAAEFVDVVEALRAGFPADAVVAERGVGVFADLTLVRPINHDGNHFRVSGPLTVPSVRPGPLPLLQAGGSPSGRDFAARRADLVFTATPQAADAIALRADLRRRARLAGRAADSIRVLPGLSLALADDRDTAAEVFRASLSTRDLERGGNLHWTVVGTPQDAVAEILEWQQAGALDGFVAFPVGWWRSAELLFDQVMPALAARGLVGGTRAATG